MIEGESGILETSPPWNRPKYEPSKRRLTWPNGARATTFSADKPEQLRGPQHTAAWADELAAWRYADAWDQLTFGLRLGDNPQAVITTTPRPTQIIKDLLAGSYDTVDKRTGRKIARHVAVTRGSTYENKGNLAPQFLAKLLSKYEGTRLGRQELEAEVLDDTPGALWKRALIESLYVRHAKDGTLLLPAMQRIVVAVDPAVSANEEGSNETGIVVEGLGVDDHGYVLDDLSGIFSPHEWATITVGAYDDRQADRVIGEINNGGNLVEATVRTVDENVAFKAVHASKGKQARAEPIAALYEQKKCHHLGAFPELEDQMCTWVPGVTKKSPDRLDAMVWGFTELMLGGVEGGGLMKLGSSSKRY